MISLPLFWIFVLTVTLVWYLKKDKRRPVGVKDIPGPRGYPILGNALQLAGKQQHLQFNKWTEEYGDIYKVKFGKETAIIVSNPKMVKELLSNDANYVGRPNFGEFGMYENELLGIVNSEGELWEVHRRFLLRQLRDLGYGKTGFFETLIFEELKDVIARFKANEGKSIGDIKSTLTLAVINSLWTVISCQRFQHDDPKLMKLVSNTNKVLQDLFESGALIMFMPWLRHIIPEISGYKKFREIIDDNRTWFEEVIAEHKKNFEEDNLRDFIDVYLSEVKKTTDPNSVFYGALAERQLAATLSDMFFAGSDTTSTTLSWAVLYLCKFPHVQKKFQEEISTISNNSRSISINDRPKMPYTLALIDEVLRYSSIVPNGVQHRALSGKEFREYFIPKDAWIMPNLHFMHHDPKVWGDPEEFRPERFLSTDGTYKKSEFLLAFQIGRRQCVGEGLARDTIFLYLTNIFQRFHVISDPDLPEPTMDCRPNFLLHPQPYNIIMKDRLEN